MRPLFLLSWLLSFHACNELPVMAFDHFFQLGTRSMDLAGSENWLCVGMRRGKHLWRATLSPCCKTHGWEHSDSNHCWLWNHKLWTVPRQEWLAQRQFQASQVPANLSIAHQECSLPSIHSFTQALSVSAKVYLSWHFLALWSGQKGEWNGIVLAGGQKLLERNGKGRRFHAEGN